MIFTKNTSIEENHEIRHFRCNKIHVIQDIVLDGSCALRHTICLPSPPRSRNISIDEEQFKAILRQETYLNALQICLSIIEPQAAQFAHFPPRMKKEISHLYFLEDTFKSEIVRLEKEQLELAIPEKEHTTTKKVKI